MKKYIVFLILGFILCINLMAEENPKVSLEFHRADIKQVVRTMSYVTNYNIIIGRNIEGYVTIKLNEVPFFDALRTILSGFDFYYLVEDNIIVILTREDYIKRISVSEIPVLNEDEEINNKDANYKFFNIISKVYKLKWVRVERLYETLKDLSTNEGKITFNEKLNKMVVEDKYYIVKKIDDMIKKIDVKPDEIEIEARIIEKINDDNLELGTNFAADIDANRNDPNEQDDYSGNMDFIPTTTSRNFNIHGITRTVLTQMQLDLFFKLLNEDKKSQLLASPKIVVLDNEEAEILIGDKLTIQTGIDQQTGQPQYTEKEVGIKLKVLPKVRDDKFIDLVIRPEISSLVNQNPVRISSREASSRVLVRNEETVVIAGLTREETVVEESKFPLLGDIPILKFFFSYSKETKLQKELLIFITPRLVDLTPIQELEN